MPPHNFWDITAANLVTWAILIAGFAISQYLAVKLLGQRMDGFEKWRDTHDEESNNRDKAIITIDKTLVELTTLARVATQRVEMLERRRVFPR